MSHLAYVCILHIQISNLRQSIQLHGQTQPSLYLLTSYNLHKEHYVKLVKNEIITIGFINLIFLLDTHTMSE